MTPDEMEAELEYLHERVGMLLAWRLAVERALRLRRFKVRRVRERPETSSPDEAETFGPWSDDLPDDSGD